MNCILGIDTSCYTTSVAILDETGRLVADHRKLLEVQIGKRGLAQSEMVFQHTRNLPGLIEAAFSTINGVTLKKIGVSIRPRSLPDSYMPAFLVGHGFARAMASANKIPITTLSHQEGHIFAGIWSAGGPEKDEFLALHVSGGTTELLRVRNQQDRMSIQLLGGTKDLNAGQMIDRVGVKLGLSFPAGPHLETLAETNKSAPSDIPISVNGLDISFSGPETHAERLINGGIDKAAVAEGVQLCIGKSLAKLINTAVQKTALSNILLVGGVLSNRYIRDYLMRALENPRIRLFFPANQFSRDNAAGVAFAALRQ